MSSRSLQRGWNRPSRLHDNFPGHLRMHPAVKRIFSWLREAGLELIVGVEWCRFELALRTVDGVGNVVVVNPSHLRARFHGDRAWSEGEIVDLDFSRRIGRCPCGGGRSHARFSGL